MMKYQNQSWAMVVDRSSASYLIVVLSLLKVEGSNLGAAVSFSRENRKWWNKNDSWFLVGISMAERSSERMVRQWRLGGPRQLTEIVILCSESFCIVFREAL